uniref:Uncharacterized protein n=1 Tax=Peronospora matthiolae TaxID=2874970 RepID=A0AAV1UQL2_9STRA
MKQCEPEIVAAGLVRLYNVDGQETVASELLGLLLSHCKQEDTSQVMQDAWLEWNVSPDRLYEVLDLGKPGVLEESVEAAWQFYRYTQWRYSQLSVQDKRHYEWITTAKQFFRN